MRFIDKFPAAAPFQAQRFAKLAAGPVMLTLAVVRLAVGAKNADIKCRPKIVPGLTAFGFGDDVARLGPPLRVKLVLLFVAAKAGNDFRVDAFGYRFLDQLTS